MSVYVCVCVRVCVCVLVIHMWGGAVSGEKLQMDDRRFFQNVVLPM